jgi:hypothetical protein
MKRLISLFVIFFALTAMLEAQTVSGYFTETTKGLAKAVGGDGYLTGQTAILKAGDSTYSIASKPFGSTASLMRNGFMNGKIMVGIQIDTAFSDVEATLVSQISYDGTTWYTLETLDADTTPNVTGLQMYLATFTNVYAPYVRLLFNGGNLEIERAGYIKFVYTIPL